MTQLIFLVLGLTMFIDALFEKWNFWDLIQKIGSESRSDFIFKLSQCRFCLRFHLSILITLVLLIFTPFEWVFLIVPGVVNGFIHLIIQR